MSMKGQQEQQRYNPKGGPPSLTCDGGTYYEPMRQDTKQEHFTDNDLRDVVDSFGRNREKKMTTKELRLCHNLLGLNPTESELRECLGILTFERHDGQVTTEDFVMLMRSKLGSDELTREDLYEAFKQYDKDGSDSISPDELREILKDTDLDGYQVDCLIRDADTDGDGTIDFEEFFELFKKMTK